LDMITEHELKFRFYVVKMIERHEAYFRILIPLVSATLGFVVYLAMAV